MMSILYFLFRSLFFCTGQITAESGSLLSLGIYCHDTSVQLGSKFDTYFYFLAPLLNKGKTGRRSSWSAQTDRSPPQM